jgi:hypothetical protein
MREPSSEPPAKWTLYGIPLQKGIALGIGAPLYLPTYGSPIWFDPRLFAQDEDEWRDIDYRMPTEPVEVIGLVRALDDIPPVLAPYVRVVGWIVEQPPEPPLPTTPILLAPKLPALLPPETTVVLDANAGVAYIEPSVAVLARYQAQALRVATHTRYHLEGAHLPVRTWDSRPIQVGGVAVDWDAAPQVAQAGAELVWLTSDTLSEDIRATGARAGRQAPVAAPDRTHRLRQRLLVVAAARQRGVELDAVYGAGGRAAGRCRRTGGCPRGAAHGACTHRRGGVRAARARGVARHAGAAALRRRLAG